MFVYVFIDAIYVFIGCLCVLCRFYNVLNTLLPGHLRIGFIWLKSAPLFWSVQQTFFASCQCFDDLKTLEVETINKKRPQRMYKLDRYTAHI